MWHEGWGRLGKRLACACVGLLAAVGGSRADELADLKARLEAQEREIRELRSRVDAAANDGAKPDAKADGKDAKDAKGAKKLDEKTVNKMIDAYLKKKDDDKKKKEADDKKKKEAEGYKVGTETTKNCTFGWDPNPAGWVFATPHKDFTFHPEARIQMDATWWHQTPGTRPATQLGNFEDGTDFRRVRIHFDGTMFEVVEYNFEFALENIEGNILTDDEQYVGLTQIPWIGTIRVGHMRIPHGLEGDNISSSKAMMFLERSFMSDAIFENFNFSPGIWASNSFFDQRATYMVMGYRTEQNANSAADFGDGEYAVTGRLTALPVYYNEGRCLLHLGFSSTWQNAEKPGTEVTGPRFIRLRARPDFARDFQGGFRQFASPTIPGSGFLPGNDTRIVDTGAITAQDYLIQAGEFLVIAGPFSVQAEAALGTVTNAVTGTGASRRVGDLNFWGGYVALSYFLTGENRLYDQRLGRLGSLYVRPRSNFWAVRDTDCKLNLGVGAWEVVARYDYLNLNDGPVQGGVAQGLTFGLNWYLNTNLKVQFDYGVDQRWHRQDPPQAGGARGNPGGLSGIVDGFAIRTQWFY